MKQELKYEFRSFALSTSEFATLPSKERVGIDCLLLFKNLITFQNFFGHYEQITLLTLVDLPNTSAVLYAKLLGQSVLTITFLASILRTGCQVRSARNSQHIGMMKQVVQPVSLILRKVTLYLQPQKR